jgi:acyl carrier protein
VEAELPSAMWPSDYAELDALPITPNGKVDRKALPQDVGVRHVRPDHVAPSTLLEKEVAAVWTDLFGIDAIDVNDDFFMLGGHSLLAVQVAGRLRARLDIDLPLRLLFEHRTVRGLAQSLEAMLVAEIDGLAEEQDAAPMVET